MHRKMTQLSGNRHVESIEGSPFEHNPHHTAHGMPHNIEEAVAKEKRLAGVR